MVCDKNYLDEHIASIQGAHLYEAAIRQGKKNEYVLRRNIHRLEKGLLMIPMRDIFGLRFIEETVNCYACINQLTHPDIHEWGGDVLEEYFKVTESIDPRYESSLSNFRQIKREVVGHSLQLPYIQTYKKTFNYDDLEKVLVSRKSVRWFAEKAVPSHLITNSLHLAKLAPSGCNRQPYRYVVTNDPGKSSEIAEVSRGTVGWSHNVQAVAVLIGRQSAFSGSLNRHSIYIDSTLSVMPFILALESQGLTTCIINWVDERHRIDKIKSLVELKDDERIILSVAIGYARKNTRVAFSRRSATENIFTDL